LGKGGMVGAPLNTHLFRSERDLIFLTSGTPAKTFYMSLTRDTTKRDFLEKAKIIIQAKPEIKKGAATAF